MYLYGSEIDQRLSWPTGRAERLAKRGKLPHVILPDGEIRFLWEEVQGAIVRKPVEHRQGASQC